LIKRAGIEFDPDIVKVLLDLEDIEAVIFKYERFNSSREAVKTNT